MANKTIQLLRNQNLYASHVAALSALQTKLGQSTFDGQPILARYTGDDDKEHTLLGIKSASGYEIFDNEGTQSAAVTSVQYDSATKKITYTKNGAQTDVVTLADVATSGAAADVAIADAGGIITATTVEGALQEIAAEIDGMNKTASAVDGQVVTTVSEASGVVSETKANVKDLKLGGYSKDTAATGDIASTDTINAALSKLENKAAAITVASADGTVTVTSPVGGGTDLAVNIDGTTLVKDASGELSADVKIVKNSSPSSSSVKEEYYLAYGSSSTPIGDTIQIYKDSALLSIKLLHAYNVGQSGEILPTYSNGTWTDIDSQYQTPENVALCYAYSDATGATVIAAVPVGDFLQEAEFGDGLQVVSGEVSVKIDSTSEDFLSVSSNGVKVSGVQDAIDAAIEDLDVTDDAAVDGQYVAAIEETDGIVAVKTRANISEAVLNNYAKGTDATAVAATDTVNEAISKLENQVDAAKAAATTVVAEGTDTGNNMTIVSSTDQTDGHTTYTISLTDVASDTALTGEIAARKAVDGQSGQTYTANSGANYIASATSLNDADVKLDTALKAADDAMLTGVAAGNGISVAPKANKSQTITAVAATNDPIIEVTESGIATKENAIFDAGTY